MKKIFLAFVFSLINGMIYAGSTGYEVTISTFNSGSISLSTSVPTIVSLTPNKSSGLNVYSVSIYNISSSSIAYTLSTSSTSSGSPVLSCSNGALIGSGTSTAPYIITEQFEGLYMWAIACGASTISDIRRVIRGR